MAGKFIGKEIEATLGGDVRTPVSFRLDGQEYVIADILENWQDYGFGKSVTGKKKWWQRHHRNYYRVKTVGGEVFEIYYDRGVDLRHPDLKKWFVTRQF